MHHQGVVQGPEQCLGFSEAAWPSHRVQLSPKMERDDEYQYQKTFELLILRSHMVP